MATRVVKLTISIPKELVQVADKIAKERKTSRSKVVSSCLQELAKKKLEEELEEGYRAMSKINKKIANEFFQAQSEVVLRDAEWTE